MQATPAEPATQYAALCYRETTGGSPEILLITSLETGRWVLPKGWPRKDESGAAAALREAGEEAGVVGRAHRMPLGLYSYDKLVRDGAIPCCVLVHPVRVDHLRFDFPERGARRIAWFGPADAARAVAEPELRELLARFVLPPERP